MSIQEEYQDQVIGQFFLIVNCFSNETACHTLNQYLDRFVPQSCTSFSPSPITIPVLSQTDHQRMDIRITSNERGGKLICSTDDDVSSESNPYHQCAEQFPRCVANLKTREASEKESSIKIIRRNKRELRYNRSHVANTALLIDGELSHIYEVILKKLVCVNASKGTTITTAVSLAISQCHKGVHTLFIHCAYDEEATDIPGLTVSIHSLA